MRRTLGEAIQIEIVLAGGLWKTHADANQLESAILNLCINARDAMPEGGKLTVETLNAHLDENYAARHIDVPAGQYVLIAITDTGTGMPPEVVSRAFDPFFHDQGGRQRHWARPQPGFRLRQAIGRSHQDLFGTRPRHDG